MNRILTNIQLIRQRMIQACTLADRNPAEVKLLLATKTIAPASIITALEAGETLIGENKVQELKEKSTALSHIPHQPHFIGHLQTNKVNDVIRYASCIQSVDRISLAEKLQKRLEYEDRSIDIFLQFNTSFEASKFGADPSTATTFAKGIAQFDRLRIKGLMTIGLFSADPLQVRKCFRLLKNIQHQILNSGIPAHELSMGMSNDLETAIEEGATIIRVGTAIFGTRPFPDSYYWNEKQ
ncbi:MAG TPA: YggS family pyridoxal phosphate-dependent enzyme [Saprospiraceae bacterium]|nr:YggS family pyridoxal phosphate-dependent enzyme [Saprospiraceae bacterium]HNA40629.1 YggS family pyridoxal phosphate-dependent enzyme [Saprospiraceae bacterium]